MIRQVAEEMQCVRFEEEITKDNLLTIHASMYFLHPDDARVALDMVARLVAWAQELPEDSIAKSYIHQLQHALTANYKPIQKTQDAGQQQKQPGTANY